MMNRDLFLAILAMDSYSRGYNESVTGLPEVGQIGAAEIVTLSSIFGEEADGILSGWEAASFYAIAYEWNGEKVISFRGTDDWREGEGDAERQHENNTGFECRKMAAEMMGDMAGFESNDMREFR